MRYGDGLLDEIRNRTDLVALVGRRVKLVRKGRAEFLAQFPSCASPDVLAQLDDPADPRTFERCKLDFTERERNSNLYAMHADLIALRRRDPVLRAPGLPLFPRLAASPAATLRHLLADDGGYLYARWAIEDGQAAG